MNISTSIKNLDLTSPVVIKIKVKGFVDEKYSDYLSELAISHETIDDDVNITELVGEIVDQAALIGVLNALYDMRFPLLKVVVGEKILLTE